MNIVWIILAAFVLINTAVFIRPEYHHRIMLLLNADDGKCSTFIGFLDNVLSEHFNLNADSINGIIASRYKNPDSL